MLDTSNVVRLNSQTPQTPQQVSNIIVVIRLVRPGRTGRCQSSNLKLHQTPPITTNIVVQPGQDPVFLTPHFKAKNYPQLVYYTLEK